MADSHVFTFQTRLTHDSTVGPTLDAYADLYGRVERTLFARMQAEKERFDLNTVKREFLARFQISGRQFNALRIGLMGKVDSIVELRKERKALILEAIAETQKTIQALEKKQPGSKRLHQIKRRLGTLQARLARIMDDEQSGRVRMTFGSRKLFRQQFHLDPSGQASRSTTAKPARHRPKTQKVKNAKRQRKRIKSSVVPKALTHEEWKAEWQRSRSSQFYVLGSQDETAGNQSCQAVMEQDGILSMKLRLPDALVERFGTTHVSFSGVRFAYGHDVIVQALQSSRRITYATTDEHCAIKKRVKLIGKALSYRFLRDEKGWRVFVSLDRDPLPSTTFRQNGAIGVDVNADHLAVAETDPSGNLLHAWRMPLVTYGKTTDQVKALIGDACTYIAEYAQAAGKPVVHEILDFRRKKQEISHALAMAKGKASSSNTGNRQSDHEKKYARMLSSLSYRSILKGLESSCFRRGVETIGVNPAYTSVIGAVNHAAQRGVSVHMGAALAIARRGLGFSERPTVRVGKVPTRKGGHVTFALPVRNRAKHGWSHWSAIRKTLVASHAASGRSVKSQALVVAMARTVPVFPGGQPEPGTHRSLRVKPPNAKGRD